MSVEASNPQPIESKIAELGLPIFDSTEAFDQLALNGYRISTGWLSLGKIRRIGDKNGYPVYDGEAYPYCIRKNENWGISLTLEQTLQRNFKILNLHGVPKSWFTKSDVLSDNEKSSLFLNATTMPTTLVTMKLYGENTGLIAPPYQIKLGGTFRSVSKPLVAFARQFGILTPVWLNYRDFKNPLNFPFQEVNLNGQDLMDKAVVFCGPEINLDPHVSKYPSGLTHL